MRKSEVGRNSDEYKAIGLNQLREVLSSCHGREQFV